MSSMLTSSRRSLRRHALRSPLCATCTSAARPSNRPRLSHRPCGFPARGHAAVRCRVVGASQAFESGPVGRHRLLCWTFAGPRRRPRGGHLPDLSRAAPSSYTASFAPVCKHGEAGRDRGPADCRRMLTTDAVPRHRILHHHRRRAAVEIERVVDAEIANQDAATSDSRMPSLPPRTSTVKSVSVR